MSSNYNQPTSPVPLRYPSKKDNIFMDSQQHKDVYKPMLSEFIVDLTANDLKLHEQWIVRRKQIIYFGTIAGVCTILLCAAIIIYVVPQLSNDETSLLKGQDLKNTNIQDFNSNPHPTLSPIFENELKRMDLNSPEQRNEEYQSEYYSSMELIYSEEDTEFENAIEDDIDSLNTELNMDENEEYLYCVISTSPQFSKFTNSCNSVMFRDMEDLDSNLTEYFTDNDFDPESIVNVRVTSPISEKMLQKIVAAFPNILRLTVGIDKLCLGSNEANRGNLPVIDLPQLQTLEVVNATRCPDLASWLFSKWNTPAIQKISISQADIPRSVFQNLTGFIERHNETLLSVDFIRCSFGNCNIDVIPLYHNLTITETQTRKMK